VVEVKKIQDFYKGLFATQQIDIDKIILYLEGNYFPVPTRTSIQITEDKHIESWEGGHINHHCNPNTEIKIHDDFIGRNTSNKSQPSLVGLVVAKRKIMKGEEITFDYNTTEAVMSEPFTCKCHGTLISGYNHYKSFP